VIASFGYACIIEDFSAASILTASRDAIMGYRGKGVMQVMHDIQQRQIVSFKSNRVLGAKSVPFVHMVDATL